METLENINDGAKFVKADLHIHSYGFEQGSFDVTDTNMTPENIVDTALSQDLKIISITDHNEILNSKIAFDYSKNKDILVIPGIEISTTQGHLLVYFPHYTNLRSFFGKLDISDDKEKCTNGIIQCLNLAKDYDGIAILAHIEVGSGFEKVIARFGRDIEDIICHELVYGLEICKKSSVDLYTEKDDNDQRKRLIKKRREVLNLPKDYNLAKIMSSDSHTLNGLGSNAEGEHKLTRVKVDSLDFKSFRIALINHESRIRLEEFIPEKIPKVLDICIEGGLLDKQIIKFSSNLTCIIGGRGTGKSTLLESIREASGNITKSSVVDSDVWGDKITLRYRDEAGQISTFVREKYCSMENKTDPEHGINKICISSYGQGETAETIQHSEENPKYLIDFLDSFVPVANLLDRDKKICEELFENQSKLIKLRNEVSRIPETKRQRNDLQNKINLLKKDNVGELVTLQSSLVKERELRDQLISEIKELISAYREILDDETTFSKFSELSEDEIIIGKESFKSIKVIINDFHKIVKDKSSELNIQLVEKSELVKTQLDVWKSKEDSIQKEIDKKKKELEDKGIPFDLSKITQISKDLIYFENLYNSLIKTENELFSVEGKRKEIIDNRKILKSEIYKIRKEFAKEIDHNLKNSVDGFFVSTKWKKGQYSSEFESALKTKMSWRTAQVQKAKIISANLSPLEFVDKLKSSDLEFLKDLKSSSGGSIFGDSDIENIQNNLTLNNAYEEFESLVYEDLPSIIVTKEVIDELGVKQYLRKPITKLSLGQQHSILLAILIQSNSNLPLIIDQPEDNLDSEFIFKTIVSNLRRIKERRQVIVVTHNANIGVLGDAELVLPLKSTSVKSVILDRGSIDRVETCDKCCEILEGGKNAFINRKQIYGI